MSSRLWDVRAGLVTLFGGITGLEVYDGPLSRTTPPKRFMLVGTDGGDTGTGDNAEDGAAAEREPATYGRREEHGDITCAAWAWSGDTDFASLRATMKSDVDAAETLIAADVTLAGVGLTDVVLTEITALRVREQQTKRGAVVRGAFTVSYRAYILKS